MNTAKMYVFFFARFDLQIFAVEGNPFRRQIFFFFLLLFLKNQNRIFYSLAPLSIGAMCFHEHDANQIITIVINFIVPPLSALHEVEIMKKNIL